jgi:hypothetical protein
MKGESCSTPTKSLVRLLSWVSAFQTPGLRRDLCRVMYLAGPDWGDVGICLSAGVPPESQLAIDRNADNLDGLDAVPTLAARVCDVPLEMGQRDVVFLDAFGAGDLIDDLPHACRLIRRRSPDSPACLVIAFAYGRELGDAFATIIAQASREKREWPELDDWALLARARLGRVLDSSHEVLVERRMAGRLAFAFQYVGNHHPMLVFGFHVGAWPRKTSEQRLHGRVLRWTAARPAPPLLKFGGQSERELVATLDRLGAPREAVATLLNLAPGTVRAHRAILTRRGRG